ncbi:hypothetical protein [Mycoplasma hafezii]|uniref:hypothetical protein n=1 Tax=Mycoplasma hafezii TaxID=525886 RepID=UPI003CEAEAD2
MDSSYGMLIFLIVAMPATSLGWGYSSYKRRMMKTAEWKIPFLEQAVAEKMVLSTVFMEIFKKRFANYKLVYFFQIFSLWILIAQAAIIAVIYSNTDVTSEIYSYRGDTLTYIGVAFFGFGLFFNLIAFILLPTWKVIKVEKKLQALLKNIKSSKDAPRFVFGDQIYIQDEENTYLPLTFRSLVDLGALGNATKMSKFKLRWILRVQGNQIQNFISVDDYLYVIVYDTFKENRLYNYKTKQEFNYRGLLQRVTDVPESQYIF